MTKPDPTLDVLDELAALALAHVEDLRADLMAATDGRARAKLARAYERAGRELRAALMLRARLLRGREAERRRVDAQARAAALQAFHDATPGPTRH